MSCKPLQGSLPLLPLFRSPSVLNAPRSQRVTEMLKLPDPEDVLKYNCPLLDGPPLYTAVVMRDPIEKIVSEYNYLKTVPMCDVLRGTDKPCSVDVWDLVRAQGGKSACGPSVALAAGGEKDGGARPL